MLVRKCSIWSAKKAICFVLQCVGKPNNRGYFPLALENFERLTHTHSRPKEKQINNDRRLDTVDIFGYSLARIFTTCQCLILFSMLGLDYFFFARHICSLAQLERFFSPQISVTSCIASKWPPNSSWLGYSIYSAQTNPFLTWIKNIRPISFPIERKDFLHEAS